LVPKGAELHPKRGSACEFARRSAKRVWLAGAGQPLDWEMLGLFFLADVLVVLGPVVAHAAGILPVGARASR